MLMILDTNQKWEAGTLKKNTPTTDFYFGSFNEKKSLKSSFTKNSSYSDSYAPKLKKNQSLC